MIGKLNLLQLHDNLEYHPDSDLAQEVLTEADSNGLLLPRNKISALCDRCSSLDLWSPRCHFANTLAGLAKEDGCSLCKLMLSRCIESQVGLDESVVKFSRTGSYLTVDNVQKQPIISLDTLSGMYLHVLLATWI